MEIFILRQLSPNNSMACRCLLPAHFGMLPGNSDALFQKLTCAQAKERSNGQKTLILAGILCLWTGAELSSGQLSWKGTINIQK